MSEQNLVQSSSNGSEPTRNGTNGPAQNGTQPARRTSGRDDTTLLPPVDVFEDASGITVLADLPGVSKDRLDVRVEAETLLIEGELGLSMPEGMAASHAEVGTTRYRRTFTLSKELDADKVDAEFNQGVLRVRIPKALDAQPRRIAVQVH